MLTETESAYIAGIIDGEGCVNITKSHKYYHTRIDIETTSRQLRDWLVKRLPKGSIGERNQAGNSERTFRWSLNHKEELRQFLPEVIPFLVIKKLHAQLLLKYCVEFPSSTGQASKGSDNELREAYYTLFRALNKTGSGSSAEKEKVAKLFALNEVALPTEVPKAVDAASSVREFCES